MTNTVTVLAESTGFSAVNTIWVLLGAALVFFMQAGFAMVETGFTRAKNAGNIIMKNLMDFCIGTPLFWLFGFGLMFGDGKFIGAYKGIADSTYASAAPDGVPFFAFLIFQTVFLCNSSNYRFWSYGRKNKVYFLLYLFSNYKPSGLSYRGSLDLGRRLACRPRLP